jgi:hypothetical protein
LHWQSRGLMRKCKCTALAVNENTTSAVRAAGGLPGGFLSACRLCSREHWAKLCTCRLRFCQRARVSERRSTLYRSASARQPLLFLSTHFDSGVWVCTFSTNPALALSALAESCVAADTHTRVFRQRGRNFFTL